MYLSKVHYIRYKEPVKNMNTEMYIYQSWAKMICELMEIYLQHNLFYSFTYLL